ncbi:tetratricopeptide repeat protein [Embleya sp. NPDC020630]|uniref:tetratricopeptide repeat protein n=1 Tax=Embleya sp. NPDC020630 TaxID=3363979 RepID=UPI00378A0823
MDTAVERHPLATLVARRGGTVATYLRHVADAHRALGFGGLAARPEKYSRWLAGATPDPCTQLAIAALHGVPDDVVHRRPWPDWLLAAMPDDRTLLESPWTPTGTIQALDTVGGTVDRRGFLIAGSTTLLTTLDQWAAAEPATAVTHGRRIGARVPDLIDTRITALRHLDDQVGAARAHDAALTELRLVTGLLREGTYTQTTGRRLFTAAAEVSRICGWTAYDTGRHAAAERHFITALRAAASADDADTGALVVTFWANLRYATGDPRGALDLLDRALADPRGIHSPRVRALVYARKARAHATAGEPKPAYRAIDSALHAYDTDRAPDDHTGPLYWVNRGEIHQFAASSALTLGDPHRALAHFDEAYRADDAYDPDLEARGAAIYLARQAEAYLALGEIDAAAQMADRTLDLGGTESARVRDLLTDLGQALNPYPAAAAIAARTRIRHVLTPTP